MYLDLFKDSFLASLILSFQSEFFFSALTAFAEMPMLLPIVVALVASGFAFAVNWFLGKWLAEKLPMKPEVRLGHEAAIGFFTRFGWLAFVLSWLSILGPLMLFVAGFFRFPLWKSLVISLLVKAIYYSYLAGFF